MAEPINLNRARKARARADAKAQSAQNRIRFGMSKGAREGAARETATAARRLEAHRRTPDED